MGRSGRPRKPIEVEMTPMIDVSIIVDLLFDRQQLSNR